jgi:hypothetical protein
MVHIRDAKGVDRELYISVIHGMTPGDAVERLGGKLIRATKSGSFCRI